MGLSIVVSGKAGQLVIISFYHYEEDFSIVPASGWTLLRADRVFIFGVIRFVRVLTDYESVSFWLFSRPATVEYTIDYL